jgi:SPP1 gp7 family putative phage head morphogenesis protein
MAKHVPQYLVEGRRKKLQRPPVWLHPKFIERRYAKFLKQQVVDKLVAMVNSDVIPRLKNLTFTAKQFRPDSATARLDDLAGEVEQMADTLRVGFDREPFIEKSAVQDIGREISSANRTQWTKIMRATIGVDLMTSEPYLATQLSLFVSQNTTLISKMKREAVDDITGIVERGLQGGLRVEAIEQQIREKTKATANKARLIARDQVSKANSQLTKLRQEDLGVSKYVWRTSKDERVRDSHKVMEGMTCAWDDPTIYINEDGKSRKRSGLDPAGVPLHPGEDYQCRCTAEPVLDDLIE